MNACIDCIPCLAKNAVDMAKRSTQDPEIRKKIVQECAQMLGTHPIDFPPPHFLSKILEITEKYTGKADLFREEKRRSNQMAEQMVQNLASVPEYDPESFESRIRMAVTGNIIDFGIYHDLNLNQAIQLIRDSFTRKIDLEAVRRVKEKMDSAKTILYLLDNCGEAVFDRVFMEPYREKIILGVRGGNILNDVTENDLAECGLAGFTKGVISNGVSSVPGTILERTSKEFQDAVQSADLIISKGLGNYETLNETTKPVAFLFLSKCQVVAKLLNSQINEIQIHTVNF